MDASAEEKEAILQKRLKQVGNYVHESVPVSDNEVYQDISPHEETYPSDGGLGQQCSDTRVETGRR
jgi:hypothetical protein